MQKSLQVPGEGEKFADLTVTVNDGGSRECVYLFELMYYSLTIGDFNHKIVKSIV